MQPPVAHYKCCVDVVGGQRYVLPIEDIPAVVLAWLNPVETNEKVQMMCCHVR